MTNRHGLDHLARFEPVLALCGYSGAGKTTALEALIPELRQRGLRIAMVKHGHHAATLDPSGKDSARFFDAGADVVLHCPGESLEHRHAGHDSDHDLGRVLLSLLDDHDLVLVEGHKGTPLPKLWLDSEDRIGPPSTVEAVLETLPRDSSRPQRLLAFIDGWLSETWRRRPLLGGILIGGHATRMGRPKQLLPFAGTTLVERVWDALEPQVDQIVLIGSGALPETMTASAQLADVPDARGPMAGMLAAMRWAPRAAWVLAACDLPLATPEAVAWLRTQRRPGRWAVLPRISADGIEPLLALYEPQAHPLLEKLATRGEAKPRLLSSHCSVVSPEPPSGLAPAWTNVNTPQHLEALHAAVAEKADRGE